MAETFNCPSCGAPLTATPGQTEVRCEFCGNTVIVPESVRTPLPEPYRPPPPGPEMFVPPVVIIERGSSSPQATRVVMTGRRRRSGCGCCGCLSALFTIVIALIIIGGVLIGIEAGRDPLLVARLMDDVSNGNVNALLKDLGISGVNLGTSSTSEPPIIHSFAASASLARSGDRVTFTWNVSADQVRLDELGLIGTQSNLLNSIPLPINTSSYSLNVTGQAGEVLTFKLVATRGSSSVNRTVTVILSR